MSDKLDMSRRKKGTPDTIIGEFARMLAYPVIWLFIRTPVTANQISFLSFILVVIAAIFLSLNEYNLTFLAGILVFINMILDNAGGGVARIKDQCSVFGHWFDGTLDRLKTVFLLAGISIGVYQQNPSVHILILGLFATVSTTLWRHLSLLKISVFKLPLQKKKPYPRIGFSTDVECLIITLGALLNQLLLVLIFFAVLINLAWVKNIMLTVWRHRKK